MKMMKYSLPMKKRMPLDIWQDLLFRRVQKKLDAKDVEMLIESDNDAPYHHDDQFSNAV